MKILHTFLNQNKTILLFHLFSLLRSIKTSVEVESYLLLIDVSDKDNYI